MTILVIFVQDFFHYRKLQVKPFTISNNKQSFDELNQKTEAISEDLFKVKVRTLTA